MGKKLLVAGNNAPKSVIEALVKKGYTLINRSTGLFPDDSSFFHLFHGEKDKSFQNAELLKDADVTFVQSAVSSEDVKLDSYAMMAMNMASTLKYYGAKTVTAILPFAPYERQDVRKSDKTFPSMMGKFFPNYLRNAGADKVLTYSPHSHAAVGHWRHELGDRYAYVNNADVMVKVIIELAKSGLDLVIGAPDGANKPNDMAQEQARLATDIVSEELGVKIPMFSIEKFHKGISETEVSGFVGDVEGKDAIVLDDMSDSGGTGKNAAAALWQRGAKSVTFVLGHHLLKMDKLVELITAKVPGTDKPLITRLVVSDSDPQIYAKIEKLKELFGEDYMKDRITVVETGFHIAEKLTELEKVQVPGRWSEYC